MADRIRMRMRSGRLILMGRNGGGCSDTIRYNEDGKDGYEQKERKSDMEGLQVSNGFFRVCLKNGKECIDGEEFLVQCKISPKEKRIEKEGKAKDRCRKTEEETKTRGNEILQGHGAIGGGEKNRGKGGGSDELRPIHFHADARFQKGNGKVEGKEREKGNPGAARVAEEGHGEREKDSTAADQFFLGAPIRPGRRYGLEKKNESDIKKNARDGKHKSGVKNIFSEHGHMAPQKNSDMCWHYSISRPVNGRCASGAQGRGKRQWLAEKNFIVT